MVVGARGGVRRRSNPNPFQGGLPLFPLALLTLFIRGFMRGDVTEAGMSLGSGCLPGVLTKNVVYKLGSSPWRVTGL
jgi:hypothetical protein